MTTERSSGTPLNEAQMAAVLHGGGPLLILAGAGSGKTRALTERLAHLIESGAARPDEILAITFTNKAAQEMRNRVALRVPGRHLGIWIMTFHQASARILRRDADRLGYPRDFVIYDTQDQLHVIRDALGRLNLDEKRYPPAGILHRISRAKNELQTPQDLRAGGGFYEEQVARIWETYQTRLQSLGALDFDDMIGHVVALLERDEEVRRHWQGRFRHLLVDEYQDTNLAQYRWVLALAGAEKNVAVVGDPDQSIYGWRGADIRNILEFEKDFPNARVVLLTENYRSTERILQAANAVIRPNRLRREKELWTSRGQGTPVRVATLQDEWQESEFIAAEVRRTLAAGTPASEVAVLYRTNAQSRTHEEALIRHGIPYRLIGGLRFYERQEVKDIIAYLRLIQNARDDLAFRRALNAPKRGLGAATLARIGEHAAEQGISFLAAAQSVAEQIPGRKGKDLSEFTALIADLSSAVGSWPPSRIVEEVAERSGYLAALRAEGTVESRSRIENVESLINKAREAEGEAEGGELQDFLAKVALLSDVDAADEGDGRVSLMTLHAAKGLEFDVVFLSGLEEGLMPHARAAYEERELEEERRLFYVGVTRAGRTLWLTRSLRRMQRGESVPSVVSRFLRDLPADAVEEVQAKMGAQRVTQRGRPVPAGAYDVRDGDSVKAGDHVRHRSFGEGTVVQVRRNGDEDEITVAFPAAGVRQLLGRYAGLERVEP